MEDEQARGRKTAISNRRDKAVKFALTLAPALAEARRELGAPSLRAIAGWLNKHGYRTPKNANFGPQSVSNALSVDDLIQREAQEEHWIEVHLARTERERDVRLGLDPRRAEARESERVARSEVRLRGEEERAQEIGIRMRGPGALVEETREYSARRKPG